ncbi:hypothetical protein DERP_006881 [Dermatophagoides pteronyssinus]|uniref:Uncharacterized protein n=1 Tax=Dermatophagoides pteronyssinus TaxID=6956 RepID=A0ABQ8IS93_DERPT|nr:hypothetical protein DERP_006881 [Dermatophagoides pteronyssinus]
MNKSIKLTQMNLIKTRVKNAKKSRLHNNKSDTPVFSETKKSIDRSINHIGGGGKLIKSHIFLNDLKYESMDFTMIAE